MFELIVLIWLATVCFNLGAVFTFLAFYPEFGNKISGFGLFIFFTLAPIATVLLIMDLKALSKRLSERKP